MSQFYSIKKSLNVKKYKTQLLILKKGGQVKMARVMKEAKFAEWEEFVN